MAASSICMRRRIAANCRLSWQCGGRAAVLTAALPLRRHCGLLLLLAAAAAPPAAAAYADRAMPDALFNYPCHKCALTSGYGPRALQLNAQHMGVDFAARDAAEGVWVYASANGEVKLAHADCYRNGETRCGGGVLGNLVRIEHDSEKHLGGAWPSWRTEYAHLAAVYVSEGDEVAQGDLIGRMGRTGWNTAQHLHFNWRPRSSYVYLSMDFCSAEMRDQSGDALEDPRYTTYTPPRTFEGLPRQHRADCPAPEERNRVRILLSARNEAQRPRPPFNCMANGVVAGKTNDDARGFGVCARSSQCSAAALRADFDVTASLSPPMGVSYMCPDYGAERCCLATRELPSVSGSRSISDDCSYTDDCDEDGVYRGAAATGSGDDGAAAPVAAIVAVAGGVALLCLCAAIILVAFIVTQRRRRGRRVGSTREAASMERIMYGGNNNTPTNTTYHNRSRRGSFVPSTNASIRRGRVQSTARRSRVTSMANPLFH